MVNPKVHTCSNQPLQWLLHRSSYQEPSVRGSEWWVLHLLDETWILVAIQTFALPIFPSDECSPLLASHTFKPCVASTKNKWETNPSVSICDYGNKTTTFQTRESVNTLKISDPHQTSDTFMFMIILVLFLNSRRNKRANL